MAKAVSTRSCDKWHIILRESVTEDHQYIRGSRLPTKRQVLMSFLCNSKLLRENDETKQKKITREAAKKVVAEVLVHYQRAGIPTVQEHKMAEKIEELHRYFESLMKINNSEKVPENPRIKQFQEDLERTMPFWQRDVMKQLEQKRLRPMIKKEEKEAIEDDINFLKSMMTDRLASYSGQDVRFATIVTARESRRISDLSAVGPVACTSSSVAPSDTESDSDSRENSGTEVGTASAPGRRHRRTKAGVNIHIPPDILKNELIQSAAIRNKISPTALSALMHSLIAACNDGDSTGLYLHHTQAYRYVEIFYQLYRIELSFEYSLC